MIRGMDGMQPLSPSGAWKGRYWYEYTVVQDVPQRVSPSVISVSTWGLAQANRVPWKFAHHDTLAGLPVLGSANKNGASKNPVDSA